RLRPAMPAGRGGLAVGGRHPRHRTTLFAVERLDPEVRGVEREAALGCAGPVPVPVGRPERYDDRCTITCMPARAAKIEIPRWIQLVGLPVLLLFLWVVVGAVRHVVFLFLVALLIPLLLRPLVRGVPGGPVPPAL